eukprot:1531527-Rhodomonas_salina.1
MCEILLLVPKSKFAFDVHHVRVNTRQGLLRLQDLYGKSCTCFGNRTATAAPPRQEARKPHTFSHTFRSKNFSSMLMYRGEESWVNDVGYELVIGLASVVSGSPREAWRDGQRNSSGASSPALQRHAESEDESAHSRESVDVVENDESAMVEEEIIKRFQFEFQHTHANRKVERKGWYYF